MRAVGVGFVLAVAAVAAAQDGNAGAGGSQVMVFIIGPLLIAIFVLGYIVMRKPKAPMPLPETAHGDDEVTQVRIQGPRLVRIQGGVKVGADVPVTGMVVVGSDPNCTIRHADDAGLAAKHAEIRREGGETVIMDRGSETGTFVNEHRIESETPVVLADGDKIRTGELTLQYRASA